MLPEERTTVGTAFEIVGTDFAGPIKYKQGRRSIRGAQPLQSCALGTTGKSRNKIVHSQSQKVQRATSKTPRDMFRQRWGIRQSSEIDKAAAK